MKSKSKVEVRGVVKQLKIKKVVIIMFSVALIYNIYTVSKMNVLDRIYYAVTHCCYQTVNKALDVKGYDWEWINVFLEDGIESMRVAGDSVEDNWYIMLTFVDQEEKRFRIFAQGEIVEGVELELSMTYTNDERKLVCQPVEINLIVNEEKELLEYPEDKEEIMKYLQEYNITEEDVQGYLDYVLYDVLVQPWVEVHGGIYEIEKMKIENVFQDDSCIIYE